MAHRTPLKIEIEIEIELERRRINYIEFCHNKWMRDAEPRVAVKGFGFTEFYGSAAHKNIIRSNRVFRGNDWTCRKDNVQPSPYPDSRIKHRIYERFVFYWMLNFVCSAASQKTSNEQMPNHSTNAVWCDHFYEQILFGRIIKSRSYGIHDPRACIRSSLVEIQLSAMKLNMYLYCIVTYDAVLLQTACNEHTNTLSIFIFAKHNPE